MHIWDLKAGIVTNTRIRYIATFQKTVKITALKHFSATAYMEIQLLHFLKSENPEKN
jgi:hypothetical protein